jgi:L-ascorbate metabolism protein UlaG (beta-lactamase superfamily)
MTAEEAAEAAQTIEPEVVVPMHYGSGIGRDDDGERFVQRYDGKTRLLSTG